MGIRNFSPQLRTSAILQTAKSVAELRTKKSCGTGIADLQNLTSATLNLRPVPLLYSPLSSAQDALKINQRHCLQSSVSKEIKKTCVKGTVARDFWPSIFFHESTHVVPDSYPKFGVLRFEAELENLLEYDSGVHMGWFTKKQRPKISSYCPFKILSITKKTWW